MVRRLVYLLLLLLWPIGVSASSFIGAGTPNSGNTILLTPHASSTTGDTAIAVFGLNSNAVTPITTTADAVVGSGSPNSGSFTIPSNAAANMIAVACAYSGSVLTAPAGFTNICTEATNFHESCDYKVLVSGDVGATKSYSGGSPNLTWVVLQSLSSATLSIDGASACTSGGNAASYNAPSITTGSANELVISEANQGGTNSLFLPANENPISVRVNNGAGTFLKATAGVTGTKQFNSSGNQTWEGATIGVVNTASVGGAFTQQALITSATTNPNASTLGVFTHIIAATDPSGWWFQPNGGYQGSNNIGGMITFRGTNTSTPLDVSTTLLVNQYGQVPMPQINPTANDDFLLRVAYIPGDPTFGGCGSIPITTITSIFSSRGNGGSVPANLLAGYDDVSLNGALYFGATGTCLHLASDAISLGIQSATAPARGTANQRVDQLGLVTLAPFGAPEPPPGCGNCGLGVGAP